MKSGGFTELDMPSIHIANRFNEIMTQFFIGMIEVDETKLQLFCFAEVKAGKLVFRHAQAAQAVDEGMKVVPVKLRKTKNLACRFVEVESTSDVAEVQLDNHC
ncbi:hypothetical protein A6E19_15935 [Pseudomonas putida]|nr:hypothetical protein A6E24_16095 [Pseudomonas putida]OCT23629.1 hypothetical protein A6E23_16705 [Pseudomonas putida]OCT24656.1 hypothetical protein A6E20_12175 [Pseudomonas putida]OCT37622.1 hypothetical protein A6E19_15935 [Pseudomonas putida]